MTRCRICLRDIADGDVHPKCLKALFNTAKQPDINLELAKLHTVALSLVGRTSLSGVQRKVSVGLSGDRATLQVAVAKASCILKPQANTYPHLPENEHLTQRLAELFGLKIAPCGLIALKDNSWAYIVRRFDRPLAGGKALQEDFCQLAEQPAKDKYNGSAELCVRIVKRFASEPGIELLKLFQQLLFAWWTGNGDLHLKNLSLTTHADGRVALTPAYDLLNTRLVIPDDMLALPVSGKRDNLKRDTWLALASYAGLPERAANRVLDLPGKRLAESFLRIDGSHLPVDMKEAYRALLLTRANLLSV